MHLYPTDLVLSSNGFKNKITIENSIFQLENLSNDAYHITLAWARDNHPIRTLEDDLLDATREAMRSGDDWKVGCATIRKNV